MADRGYPVVVIAQSEDEGGGFVAYAPDLHGCMGDGDSREAAMADLSSAIEEWVDEAHRLGREIPRPGQIAELAQQERVKLRELVEAQGKLIAKQDDLLAAARQEIRDINVSLSALGEQDIPGDRSYLAQTWTGLAVQSQTVNVSAQKSGKRLPH